MKTGNPFMQQNAIESDAGYRVIRQTPDKFTAWRPVPTTDTGLVLMNAFPDADSARAACVAHFESTKGAGG